MQERHALKRISFRQAARGKFKLALGGILGIAALSFAGCEKTASVSQDESQSTGTTSEQPILPVDEFLESAEKQLADFEKIASHIQWKYATNINTENEKALTVVNTEGIELAVALANATKVYKDMDMTPTQARKMSVLRQLLTIPAPSTPGIAEELAEITTRLSSTYSKGTITFKGETIPQNETELLMRQLQSPAQLQEVWTKWRENTKPMKADYARMVAIANAGARELGFADTGEMWRSAYNMSPAEFSKEADRLWGQVKPLYDALHCHVRAKLNEVHGDDVVPLNQPIRADLLGNMWAQQWGALSSMVRPQGAGTGIDLDQLLHDKEYTPLKMVRVGEDFFSSLGFAPLPDTFWEHSQFTKPADRNVICHASAWNLDAQDDIRIKMCINVDGEDFRTIHHELGHNYYQRAYKEQPHLFKSGAHDGFHEAIGDMLALSITPAYLQQIGLLDKVPAVDDDIALLMDQALEKIAFLPFGLLIDKWRWQVFSGELTPATYNEGWWALREEYQGIRSPAPRSAQAFDPGAKFHIPNNTPYMRYFLAHIMQFQFYQAACAQAGWEGPLHRCSFYGKKEMGQRFNAMMEVGMSQPWPDTLELFTGEREMDGQALISYFEPLLNYLAEQNKTRSCGW